jgi:N4-gp56 family major capsid protein
MTGTLEELKNLTERIGLSEPDGQMSHQDILNRIPEVWSALIESEADRKRIIRGLSRVFTDLVNHPGDTLKIPQRSLIDYTSYPATDLAELTPITPTVELNYKLITVTPTEVGLGGKITKQAIDEAMVSLINDVLMEMARSVAQREDLDGIAELCRPSAVTGDQATYIEANSAGNPYISGAWTVTQAGTLSSSGAWFATYSATQSNIGNDDVIDLGVISQAQDVIMINNGFLSDTLILHPKQIADLKVSSQFLETYKAGDNSVFKTGQVGDFFGLNVMVSRNMPRFNGAGGTVPGYQAALIDSSAALALVIKRLVTVETDYRPAERMHYIFITSMYKFARVNPNAVILINTA